MTPQQPNESSYSNPQQGAVLAGKYRIEAVLGKGGMGVVVAATHVQLGQRVAIKYLLQPDNRDTVTRFLREARAAVRLRSEHVARVTDVGELENGAPYMVMEYLDGGDLQHYIKKQGKLPIAEAIDYLLQTCEAISEAHAAGIIHRDLKPANLFLATTPDGTKSVKVIDFGISKVTDNESDGGDGMQLTKTEVVLGSPLYMSPEQIKSSKDVDPRSDLWSLGVILYQLLTGKVPFIAMTFSELVLKVNLEQPPAMSCYRSDIPAELEAIILKCLEKKREDRFNNTGEFALSIAEFGSDTARSSAEKAKRVLEAAGILVQVPSLPRVSQPELTTSTVVMPASTPPPAGYPLPASVPPPPANPSQPPNAFVESNTQSSLPTVALSNSAPTGGTITSAPAKGRTALLVGVMLTLGLAAVAGIFVMRGRSTPPVESHANSSNAALVVPEKQSSPAAETVLAAVPTTTVGSVEAPAASASNTVPATNAAPAPTTQPTSSHAATKSTATGVPSVPSKKHVLEPIKNTKPE